MLPHTLDMTPVSHVTLTVIALGLWCQPRSGTVKCGVVVLMFVWPWALGCGGSSASNKGGNSSQPTYSVAVTVAGLTAGTAVKITDSDSNASISTGNTSGVTLESGL